MTDLTQYGLSGIVIAGLCWFVLHLIKEHKEERKDWKQTTEKQFDEMNKASERSAGLLSEIKTILNSHEH